MALPKAVLEAAEKHNCFSGCYAAEPPAAMVIDPNKPPVTSYEASCQDCQMFRLGSLASLLPIGMTKYGLAQELDAHMRAVRGYRWALSGYHAPGNGYWLTAAYYGDGLFLVDASRNHGGISDVKALVQGFKDRLVSPDDPQMTDPGLYDSEIVHLSCFPALVVRSKADILRSPQCSISPRQGARRVAVVRFLPMALNASNALPQPVVTAKAPTPAAPLVSTASAAPVWSASDIGKNCGKCNRAVKPLTILGKTEYNCMC